MLSFYIVLFVVKKLYWNIFTAKLGIVFAVGTGAHITDCRDCMPFKQFNQLFGRDFILCLRQ